MKKMLSFFAVLLVLVMCFGISSQAYDDEYFPEGTISDYYIMPDSTIADSITPNSITTDSITLNAASDSMQLGSLSAKYESNGNPGTISEGKDTGGVSYGAYQFSSTYGVPLDFAEWCISSGEGVFVGNRLITAYENDGNKYGNNFNAEWRAIAQESSSNFLRLQHAYTKARFYDVMVAKLEKNVPGFDIDNYTIALKNVIWSRAVQNGVNSDVITKAFESLGGFNNQPEDVLIKAIYARASYLVDYPPELIAQKITASSAEKYGIDPAAVEGKYLYYFCRNSSDVQVAVYKRLAITERQEALDMYVAAGGVLTPGEPTYVPPQSGGLGQITADTNIFSIIFQLCVYFVEVMVGFITNFIIGMAG
ncbi:MAG: hypothetical protein J6B25_00555 [Clostridia bacterium]|nr:hypothetical protein [Clostridia bacterium]